MYAEFSQISVLSMSNTKLFLVKDDDEDEEQGTEFDIVKRRPVLEFQEERDNQATANSSRNSDEERGVPVEEDEEKKGGEYQCDVIASKESEEEVNKKKRKRPSLGELKVIGHHDDDVEEEEEEDGFKTPTSFDHKIPVMKQCPPAPRKPKPCNFPSSLHKRKASPTTRRSLQLDLSHEVESLFPKSILADLHRKIKKARTEDNKQ